jgi:Txe/YoeB family toxin of toxin-antitoxin system
LVRKRSSSPKSPAGPWAVVFTRQAAKDAKRVAKHGLRAKVEVLLAVLAEDSVRSPPPFEKLVGDLSGAFSRRINIQHRLVCEVLTGARTVRVLRMWTHYE